MPLFLWDWHSQELSPAQVWRLSPFLRKKMNGQNFSSEWQKNKMLPPFFCATSQQRKHSTQPGHGNISCPSHVCPRWFDRTVLMLRKILQVPLLWSIQGWEEVNYIFLFFFFRLFYLRDMSVNILWYREK